MSYSPVGDTVAIIRITWQVYDKIYVVARDAHKDYSKLVADLRVFSDQVKTIRGVFDDSRDAHAESLRTVLRNCSQTLVEFKEKLAKYNDLGRSERESRLRRIQWVKEQATINDFRQKLENHRRAIQFALTINGLTTNTEKSQQAIENDSDSGIADLHAPDACEACSSHKVRRMNTAESSPGLRSARGSLVPTPTLACSCFQKVASTSCSYYPRRTEDHIRRPSDIEASSASCSSCSESIYHLKPFIHASSEFIPGYESSSAPETPRRLSTKLTQPDPNRLKHEASPNVQDLFRQDYILKKEEISYEHWLCFATWWLMKSRAILKTSGGVEEFHQVGDHEWTTTTSAQQCYADLLKSSWILEEIIFAKEIDPLDTRRCRTISHLTRALDEDLYKYQEDMRCFRNQALVGSIANKPNMRLTEGFTQSIENQAMNDPFSAHRWIDVDQDDRGAKNEKVMFQTFVNAQLGNKGHRDKSHDAPYTLLLWTMRGETGLFVSLCNQKGTVNLARSMVEEDLKDYERGRVQSTLVLEFDFPNQETEIRFVNVADVHAFFKTPKGIFDKTSDKRARPGELAIFQTPIKSCIDRSLPSPYRDQQDKLLKSGKYSSCGLRLYESTDEKCWKTTRRLIVSSTPEDDFDVECLSYWLPLDQIQLAIHDCEVTMSWSDCGQLTSKSEGSWNHKYFFIYNAAKPNRKLILEFENAVDVRIFEDCLLFPTDVPAYAPGLPPQVSLVFKVERPSLYQDIRIYRLVDQDDLKNEYHAIVHAFKNPNNFHISHIYYVYRDIDWTLSDQSLDTIDLQGLVSPDYESTMRRLPYEPRYGPHGTDPIPIFKEVIETTRTASLPLGCIHNLSKFMHALTRWRLIYHHCAPKLSLPGRENYKNIAITLWTKSPTSDSDCSKLRLVARFSSPATPEKRRWMTAVLSTQYDSNRDGLELKDVALWRGSHIDILEMMASKPERVGCKVGIVFGGVGEKKEFVQLVFGRE